MVECESSYIDSLKVPTCSSFLVKSSIGDSEDFFRGEQLATVVNPKCGSCRCGKCPVPGSRYSYREENELKLIDENMRYNSETGSWVAKYPLLFPRDSLKGNRQVAMRSLLTIFKV